MRIRDFLFLAFIVVGGSLFVGCRSHGTVFKMAETMIYGVSAKVKEYEMLCGELPSMEDGLNALVERPASLAEDSGWVQLYEEEPLDPWGNPIRYLVDEELPDGFGIYSCGPDGVSESEGNDPDDINTWD